VDFSVVQSVMATQHATKNDEKEPVHRLVLWTVGKGENGRLSPIHRFRNVCQWTFPNLY